MYAISDHLPVCCTQYVNQLPKHEGRSDITYRSYKRFCENNRLNNSLVRCKVSCNVLYQKLQL